MSTAAAKAEARRKAILARKSERLEKLTTSARGEDATYLHQDQQTAHNATLNEFVGESSGVNMPTPAGSRATSQASLPQQLRTISQSSTSDRRSVSRESSLPPFDASLLSFPTDPQFESQQGINVSVTQKPKTLYQMLVPVIHMLSMGCLLLCFVLWRAGEYSYVEHEGDVLNVNLRFWERWAELARQPPQIVQEKYGVNFFWSFTTLQIVLHSTRLLSGVDDLQASTFLLLVLSQLPQQISTVVLSILRYMQLGAMFLDDVACLVVASGFLVYIATLITS